MKKREKLFERCGAAGVGLLTQVVARRGRFPPRVCTPHVFHELGNKSHFLCKYEPPVDKDRILWALDKWRPLEGGLAFFESLGIKDPESQWSFRPFYVLRAVVKIGVNLLAEICDNTQADRATFAGAVAFVLGESEKGPSLDDSGFALNDDAQSMGRPKGAHKFMLTCAPAAELSYNWGLDCAFFGGRVGATVAFPGIYRESWMRAEVTVPLQSNDWTVVKSEILLPRRMRVEWGNLTRVIPSVPITNLKSSLRIERPHS